MNTMTMTKHITNEERANTLTHTLGILFTLAIATPLIRMSAGASTGMLVGTILFLVGMLTMYTSSTLYHLVLPGRHKQYLRVLDHASIYIMIAGSYSPICLGVLGGRLGWGIFIFLWLCVIAGIIGKIIALGKHPRLSLALYLAMGWTALTVIYPLWLKLGHDAFFAIILEGIYYSAGAYFFKHDEEHPFYHAIWHVFILIGSLCHTLALFWML